MSRRFHPLKGLLLALPLAAQMPPAFHAQQHQMFMQQMQMQQMQMMQWRTEARQAAKRAQQAALVARRGAPNAQPLLAKPSKEAWVGPALEGDFQPCLEGTALLAVAKEPRKLMLLDRITGKVRWEAALDKDLLLAPTALSKDVLYVTRDDQGVLLDLVTGAPRHKLALAPYDRFLMSAKKDHPRVLPPVEADGRLLLAVYGKGRKTGNAEGKMQTFDLATGTKAWEVEIPGGPDLMPALHGSRVIVGGAGWVMALEVATGQEAWKRYVGSPYSASEMDFGFQDGNRLLLTCANARIALDLISGMELWREKVRAEGSSTLTGEGDRAVHLESRGFLVKSTWLVALDAATGKLAWEREADKTRFPWAQDGRLTCNQENDLVQLDLKDGKVLWQQALGSRPATDFLPGDGVLYVAHTDGKARVLKALSLQDGQPRWSHALATPYEGGFILADDKGLVYRGEGGRPVRVE